jgi:hypothetical protein
MPSTHQPESLAALVARFRAQPIVNYTEVRARLLFAHWDSQTHSIPTWKALESFETHRPLFEPLLERCSGQPNDLVTVAKYRDANATYYAPGLDAIVKVIAERFRVVDIQFGPYEMSEYFPLIFAVRR